MTFGIDVFFEMDAVVSAGFELNFIVTETGAELLTTTPMLMWDE